MSFNASMSTDVVQRILLIPEIQDKIFSFNKVGDAFRCSLVCKSWHPVALDHIWHTVPSLRPLLNFLAPVTSRRRDRCEVLNFKRIITVEDRARFSSIIAWRVKCLETSPRDEKLCKSALFKFSKLRSETTDSILPNLKRLDFRLLAGKDSLDLAALFLHSRLEWLSITGGYDAYSAEIKAFLSEVTLKSSNLQRLAVSIHYAKECTAELMRLILVQKSLVTLIVPDGILTVPFLERLSCLPELRRATYSHGPRDNTELSSLRTPPCNWRDDSVQFPSIRFLQLHAPFSTAGSFISTYPSFTKLVGLQIEMIFRNDAKDLCRFLEIVSDTCVGLEILKLWQYNSIEDDGLAALDVVTKDILAPLVSLRALRVFSLRHPRPIQMTDDELVDFLDSCPKFTSLMLSPYPYIPPSDISLIPTLAILHRLVSVQPKLEHLSMYFNGLKADLVKASAGVIIMPFEKLRSLDVGYTHINGGSRMALYLVQVLPLDCRLESEENDGRGGTEDAWLDVVSQLRLLRDAVSHYREQACRLNDENVRLKKAMKAAVLVLEAMCPGEEENRLGIAVSGETETEHAA